MKLNSFITTFVSTILLFVYLTAIVGFDVHTDHHDGEVFVVSLLGHTDCESLHPEDLCHCLEHHHGHCDADDEDCEDEVSAVTLTGDGYDLECDLTPVVVALCSTRSPIHCRTLCGTHRCAESPDTPPDRYPDCLCVLRL